MPWRLPDLVALFEGFGASDHAPRAKRRVRASLRHARFDAPARWLGFGRTRTILRGLSLELVAPVGEAVRADRSGVVGYVVSLAPGGVGLAIDHGAGSGSVWLHLARVRFCVGDAVEVGASVVWFDTRGVRHAWRSRAFDTLVRLVRSFGRSLRVRPCVGDGDARWPATRRRDDPHAAPPA